VKPLLITRRNSTFQVLQALKTNRAKRGELREVFIEGTVGIKAAAQAGKRFTRFLYNDYRRLSLWAKELLADHPDAQAISLERELYEDLCDKEEPSELLATVEKETVEIARTRLTENPLVLVLDRPSNHGNLGAMIRSANAFGVELVVTLGHSVDPFDPAVIRASRGSVFFTPICQEPSASELLMWLERLRDEHPNIMVLGTDSKAERLLPEDHQAARPAVLLMGNESKGLSVRLKGTVDRMIGIPMRGQVDSLNVACAASIVLFELASRPVRDLPVGRS